MQQSQRHLLAVACIVFAWIAIGGCSVNGSIREGDPRAIQYGKQLEPVVRRFQVAEARFDELCTLIDPSCVDQLDALRRIRDERLGIVDRFRANYAILQSAIIQLDKLAAPSRLTSFHAALRAKLVAKAKVWAALPHVLDQILKADSFEPGRSLVERDSALYDVDGPSALSLIPEALTYRNPWLAKASSLEIYEPEAWWSTLFFSASIAWMGVAIVGALLLIPFLAFWNLAGAAFRRIPLAIWPSVVANFLGVAIAAGCIGAGAAGMSVGIAEPGTAPQRWFSALVLLAGLLAWTRFAVREGLERRRTLPDWLEEGEECDQMIQAHSRLITAGLCGLSVGFVVFFWAYFAPRSLPQPWSWFYERPTHALPM